jgi:hypothetical protein
MHEYQLTLQSSTGRIVDVDLCCCNDFAVDAVDDNCGDDADDDDNDGVVFVNNLEIELIDDLNAYAFCADPLNDNLINFNCPSNTSN